MHIRLVSNYERLPHWGMQFFEFLYIQLAELFIPRMNSACGLVLCSLRPCGHAEGCLTSIQLMLSIQIATEVISKRKEWLELYDNVRYLREISIPFWCDIQRDGNCIMLCVLVLKLCSVYCCTSEVYLSELNGIKAVGCCIWMAGVFSLVLVYQMLHRYEVFFLILLLLERDLALTLLLRTKAFVKHCSWLRVTNLRWWAGDFGKGWRCTGYFSMWRGILAELGAGASYRKALSWLCSV